MENKDNFIEGEKIENNKNNYKPIKEISSQNNKFHFGKQIIVPRIATWSNGSKDFLARLEGLDKNYKKVSVVITSASDTVGIIDANFNYFHNSPCNIYISSIRDIGPERAYLLQKIGFSKELNGVIEFPLAKMSRKNANWYTAKAWYDTTVQNMLEHILKSKPFEVW